MKTVALIAFLITALTPAALADIGGGGLTDYLGNGITSTTSGSKQPLDIGIAVSGAIVDPRTRTWNLSSGSDSCSVVQSTSPWVDNISQFGGTNLSTGTGTGGAGIPRVTVSSDSSITNISGTISLPTLAATSTKQSDGTQKSQTVDASGNVQPSGDVLTRKIFVQNTDGSNNQGYTASSEAKVSVTQPIPAGTNIMGKVGIDQTTPGTTNGVQVNAALPTGSNVIGALTPNQSVNVAQVNGVTPSVNTGASGTGTQRVTLAADGQKTMANSTALVLSSDQTGINTFLDKSGTGSISALNGLVSFSTNGMSTLNLSAQGTFSATLQVQGQAGDNAWVAVIGYVPGAGNTSTVLTGASNLIFPIGGFNQVRVIAIAYTSGTANIQYNLGSGTQGQQVFNLFPASLQATVTGSGAAGTPSSGVVSIQGVSGGTVVPANVSQIAGNAINTGTGAASTGTQRVAVANDSLIKVWDGTNQGTVKAASTLPGLADTAVVVTQRPDNYGTVTQTSVSCASTSTTLLAASTATMFLSIRNPTTATQTIWINVAGSAAVAAAPSIDLAPGSEADFFADGPSFLPSTQINCISGGTASTVTVMYK